jgi:hypothetical protein
VWPGTRSFEDFAAALLSNFFSLCHTALEWGVIKIENNKYFHTHKAG